ncbi:MAG: hypothetical protein H0V96_02365 [Acidimicrobiia bacterium]|nr:hypothetical protein [Acidimicrobiia bacterium]
MGPRVVGGLVHRSGWMASEKVLMALRRRFAPVIVVVLTLAGCGGGGGLLDTLGERSHEYVEGTTTIAPPTTAPVASTGGVGLKSIGEGVAWYNDGIGGSNSNEVAVVISAVWRRGDGENRFIQATAREISVALPGVQFLSRLPGNSTSITSQLVYDTASATLDVGVSAAFGVWAGTPYEVAEDRLVVLRIGQDVSIAADTDRAVVEVDDGVNLIWSDGLYQYELFCAQLLTERQCHRIAGSFRPLEAMVTSAVAAG